MLISKSVNFGAPSRLGAKSRELPGSARRQVPKLNPRPAVVPRPGSPPQIDPGGRSGGSPSEPRSRPGSRSSFNETQRKKVTYKTRKDAGGKRAKTKSRAANGSALGVISELASSMVPAVGTLVLAALLDAFFHGAG